MKRDACLFLLAVGAAVAPGCYCSHELHPDGGGDDAGTGDDSAMPEDTSPPEDHATLPDLGPPVDGGLPPCVSHCPAPEVVASLEVVGDDYSETSLMDVTATDGAVWVLVDRNLSMPPSELESVYVLFRYDLATHALASMDVPMGIRTHPPLRAGDVRADGDALRVVALTTPLNTYRRRDANLATATWDAAGAVTYEQDDLASRPFVLQPSTGSSAAVFGRDALDFALFSDGAVMHAYVYDRTSAAAPNLVDLVALPDEGALEPIAGAVLDDGRLAIAGGGPAGGAARTPFLAVGMLADAPLAPMPLVGEAYDPAPLLVAERDGGFAVVRYATDTTDLGMSMIHVRHYDATAMLASEALVPTLGGLQPVAMTTFATDGHVGLVWGERVFGTTTGVSLRVLWPGTDGTCPTVGADPIIHVDTTLRGLLAARGSDGAAYIVTLDGARPPTTLTVRRVDACSVARP